MLIHTIDDLSEQVAYRREIEKMIEEGITLKEKDLLWFVMWRSRGATSPGIVREILDEQGLPYGSKNFGL